MASFPAGSPSATEAEQTAVDSLSPQQRDIYVALLGCGFDEVASRKVACLPGVENAEQAINLLLSGAVDDEGDDDSDGEDDLPPKKMIIVVRKDLGMTPGKVSAQACHACLAAYRLSMKHGNSQLVNEWELSGEPIVTLGVDSDAELEAVLLEAISRKLIVAAQHDAGRTEVAANTRTCIAIGPCYNADVDGVTGRLRLYK